MDHEITHGCSVIFYDCQQAKKDRDFSGKNPKHWPVGKILKRYITEKKEVGGLLLGGDDIVDIERLDSTVSKGHFTSGIKLVTTWR